MERAITNRERFVVFGLAALLAYAVLRCVLLAITRAFWFDEIFTSVMAHLSGPTAIWRALQNAVDSNPPGFQLFEWALSRIIHNQELALRLPSILGFCVIVICLFLFVERRNGKTIALCCAALPLITVFFEPYAVEARPYVFVSACVSFALVCYQRAPAIRWMILLGLALAISQSMHYYSVFALVPFGIAELAFTAKNHRVRWPVWLALLVGFLPFIPCWPLLKAFGKYNGAHFWAQESIFSSQTFYSWFFKVPFALGIGVAAASILAILATMRSAPSTKAQDDGMTNARSSETPFEEHVLLIALILLPSIVFIATKVAYGAMTERYVLPAGLGIMIAAGYVLARLERNGVYIFAVFICFVVVFQEARFWQTQAHNRAALVSPAKAVENLVASAPTSNSCSELPIVIPNGQEFLPIAHYASSEYASRLVTLVDVTAAITYSGSDSLDQGLIALRGITPLRAIDYPTFAAEHDRFFLYTNGQSQFDWWPSRLMKEGETMTLVALEGSRKLYLVKLKASPGCENSTK